MSNLVKQAQAAETLIAELLEALKWAESFVSGFEGVPEQNIDADLAVIRATIASAEAR